MHNEGIASIANIIQYLIQYFSSVLQYFSSANFALQVLTRYSKFDNVIRNIQNKLGKRALKSDQKLSTVIGTTNGKQQTSNHILASTVWCLNLRQFVLYSTLKLNQLSCRNRVEITLQSAISGHFLKRVSQVCSFENLQSEICMLVLKFAC